MKHVPAFKIYKEGVTKRPVVILKDVLWDDAKKRAKYIYLGYTIIEM
jgi:hypothetical protein